MSKLRPPSSIRPIDVPVFCIRWYATTPERKSIVAYGGGGGSAKTGVSNKIMVRFEDEDEVLEISTGIEICGAIQIYQDHTQSSSSAATTSSSSPPIYLLAAVGYSVVRYSLPDGVMCGQMELDHSKGLINALAVHAMGTVFCAACDGGTAEVYQMITQNHDNNDTTPAQQQQQPWKHLFSCVGHEKALCAVQFALRSSYICTSAKDGTARVWKDGGDCVAVLKCDITDPKAKPVDQKKKRAIKRPERNMVRGVAFGDLEGKVVYTVASSQRGTAFLSRWVQNDGAEFVCQVRTAISKHPISAFALSDDAGLAALGSTNGDILLVDVGGWKIIQMFPEVHDFPVSAIAARPFSTPLLGDGPVPMHAISCSADSKMGLLTLVKKIPPKNTKGTGEITKSSSSSFNVFLWCSTTPMLLWCLGLLSIIFTIVQDTMLLCSDDMSINCIYHTVLIAPSTRPGILVPPH